MSEDDNFQLCANCAKKQMCEISWKTNFRPPFHRFHNMHFVCFF